MELDSTPHHDKSVHPCRSRARAGAIYPGFGAAATCPSVVLYDDASDPTLVGQQGDNVTILRRRRLEDISVGEVVSAIRKSSKIGGI